MADPLIVEKLNGPPFNKSVTLVSLTELSPSQLLQLTNDVFAYLSSAHRVDVRDEPPEVGGPRMCTFLQLLKYPGASDPRGHEALGLSLCRGDRDALFPVLTYVLARLPALKKRAYVARYLVPLEVPPECASDDTVGALLQEYRHLQGEFKETHKALERVVGGGGSASAPKATPGELKKEIAQLEDERGQLIEKIASLKRKTGEIKGFAPLLDLTSSLRKEQEEEARLGERMAEQRAAVTAAERRYTEVNHRLAETRAHVREDMTSGAAVMEALRKEVEEGRELTARVLPASTEARRNTLARLEKMLAVPPRTEAQLAELRGKIAHLEGSVGALSAQVASAQSSAGDEKLAMFRQQSALVAKKLAQREEALEALKREGEGLAREVESRESKLSELSGPNYMKKEEFKAYAASLRTKTAQFKALKAHLGELRQETVVLARTESLLKGRVGDIDAFLKRLEEKKGVAGYTAVQSDLEKVSKLKSRIDESKSATLQEISRIVEDIQKTIEEKKVVLAPKIKALHASRALFNDTQAKYVRERSTYESVAVGLEAEKAALERQADALQGEAVAEAAKVHVCAVKREVLEALAVRAREEAAFEAGEGRFMPNFKTHKELYTHKVSQVRFAPRVCARHSTLCCTPPALLFFLPPFLCVSFLAPLPPCPP
jgi:intraflagellar transport protein 81